MNKSAALSLACLALALGACNSLPSWMGGGSDEKPKLPGQRITVIPPSDTYQPDAGLKSLAIQLPPVFTNPEWAQHTGVVTSASSNLAGGSFAVEQSATAGEGETFEHVLVTRPVVAAGTVFVMDAAGNISAHDAANIGTIRWQSKGVSEHDAPDILGGGLAYNQGKLYVLSGRGAVAAIDAASGKQLWRKEMKTPFRSAPKVADGRLFAVTIDSQTYAFNAATGEVLWNHRGINETAGLMNSVSPVLSGYALIVPYASGELYSLSADEGKEIWTGSLAMTDRTQASSPFAGIGGDPVVDGDVVFAVSSGGLLSVFGATQGQRLWDRPVSSMNTPWVAGDYLFVLTGDNTLLAMVKYNGGIRWATKLESFEDEKRKLEPITWKGPVLVNGKLAVVSSNGQMKLINATDGTIAETREIPDGVYTAPVVAGGRMYLVDQDAKLYSFQ